MTDFQLLYIPCKDFDEAAVLAKHLLGLSLIACANIIPGMTSLYHWNGKLEESSEVLLLAKSHKAKRDRIEEEIKKMHSYECPCIASLPLSAVNEGYLSWMSSQLGL